MKMKCSSRWLVVGFCVIAFVTCFCVILFATLGVNADCRFSATNSEVVVSSDAPQVVRFAAKEATNFLSRVLGGPVPIVDHPTGGKSSLILGDNGWARDEGLDVSMLGTDSFYLRAKGCRVYVCGKDDPSATIAADARNCGQTYGVHHGTLMGVYDFLERFAGCRFYFAHDLGTVVPRRTCICVPAQNRTIKPACVIREYYLGSVPAFPDGGKTSDDTKSYLGLNWLRLRMGGDRYACCHGQTSADLSSRFATSHPEYFALLKDRKTGELRRDTDPKHPMTRHPEQICQSSGVWDEFYEDAKAFLTGKLAAERGVHNKWDTSTFGWNSNVSKLCIDFQPQDAMVPCLCKKCQSVYTKEPNFATDLMWGNWKRLAERIKADGFETKVMAMSYPPYSRLPDFELPDNLVVVLARKGPWGVVFPDKDARDAAEIEAWTKKTGARVKLWNYPGQWGRHARPGIPPMSPRAYGKYYKNVSKWMCGAFVESETSAAVYNYLNHYVLSRIFWDPETDVEAVLSEHYRLMFGAAAPEMAAFYDELETKWIDEMVGFAWAEETNWGPAYYQFPSELSQWLKVYSPTVLKRWGDLFAKGLSKVASDSDEAKRLLFIRKTFLDPLAAEAGKFLKTIDVQTALAERKVLPDRSILENGDFATLKGWRGAGELDAVDPELGLVPVKLTSAGSRVFATQRLGAKLKRGTRYRLSYFTKQTELGGTLGGGAYVEIVDEGSDQGVSKWRTFPGNPSHDAHGWIHRVHEFTTGNRPDPDGKSAFEIFINRPGTVWFAGLRLEEIGSKQKP